MSKSTRATLALKKVGVNFTLHSYDYDPAAEHIGLQAAEAIGIEPRRVLKTLMAEVDGKPVCVIVPADRDEAAMIEPSVFLNGGQRGLQIQLEPNDVRKAVDAIARPLTA